jgi:hypothetical protein
MRDPPAPKEPQHALLFDVKEKHGVARRGLMVNESWNQDPRRTLFTLARYKFDFDPLFIADVKERMNPYWPLEAVVHDMLEAPVPGSFVASYALDVLEHIPEADEGRFIRHVIASLTPEGVAIFGMPSLESQAYASPQSKAGHVNCKSGEALKSMLERFFHIVFVFSMNHEVVHTGFFPMAHYLLAVACHRRDL